MPKRDDRMTIRFTAEDTAWIAEQAADEGVDDATFVRMLVNRLRRNRPPLIRMALEAQPALVRGASDAAHYGRSPAMDEMRRIGVLAAAPRHHDVPVFTVDELEPQPQTEAESVLERRMAEVSAQPDNVVQYPVTEADEAHQERARAAIPLNEVPRERFNPGRR